MTSPPLPHVTQRDIFPKICLPPVAPLVSRDLLTYQSQDGSLVDCQSQDVCTVKNNEEISHAMFFQKS